MAIIAMSIVSMLLYLNSFVMQSACYLNEVIYLNRLITIVIVFEMYEIVYSPFHKWPKCMANPICNLAPALSLQCLENFICT